MTEAADLNGNRDFPDHLVNGQAATNIKTFVWSFSIGVVGLHALQRIDTTYELLDSEFLTIDRI